MDDAATKAIPEGLNGAECALSNYSFVMACARKLAINSDRIQK